MCWWREIDRVGGKEKGQWIENELVDELMDD